MTDHVSLINVLINAGVSRGEVASKTVAEAATALVKDTTLKPEELLALFEIIPRDEIPADVFQTVIIPRFLDAEKQLHRIDASKSLVTSGFRGCAAPYTSKAFVQIASEALTRVAEKEGAVLASSTANEDLFNDVLTWSLRVLAAATAENMAAEAVGRANTIIAMTLNKSSFFFFAPIVDALRAAKKLLPAGTTAVVESLLEDVLVQAAGPAAFDAFTKKNGADLAKIFADAKVTLDQAALQRKARMIALTKILKIAPNTTSRVVKIAEVTAGLALAAGQESDNNTAENTVIDAATADLLSVQIDRAQGTIRVMDTAVLRFDSAAWKSLKKRVDDVVAVTDRLAQKYELA